MMKTQIVYCLVSDDEDYYYEQLLISLYSFRKYNANADVTLIIDDKTNNTLVDKRAKVFDYVNNVITIIPPVEYNKPLLSRYLKTNIRDIINGDYLFIDTDTLICDSLSDIDNCAFEIGAVLDNHHGKVLESQLAFLPEEHEWHSLKGSKHYNSGVFYVKDTPNTHDFYHTWYKYWQEGVKNGILFDQLPLRKTIIEFNRINIGELNGIWNCQAFRADSKQYWKNAKIFHCQGFAKKAFFPMTSTTVYEKIKRVGSIPSDIAYLIENNPENLQKKCLIIEGRDLDFYESPMRMAYYNYPRMFSFFVELFKAYRSIAREILSILKKMKRIFSKMITLFM